MKGIDEMEIFNKLRNIVKKEDDKLNFNILVEEWLENKKISIKESTYCNYVYVINKYIIPTFENIENKELQNYNFNDFVIELMKELSTKTVRDILCILKSILCYANEEYDKYKDDDFFLTGSNEKFIEPRNYQKYFKNALRKCRIKSYKFHTLRHTFASNCIEVGMDVKSLSEMLGHSSVEITLNKYVHSNYKLQKKYLEKL